MWRLIAASLIVVCCGCTDAEWGNATSLGSEAHVRLFSGGKCVGEWTSTGKVLTEDKSDGYIFRDKETKKFVRVSGEVIIEN